MAVQELSFGVGPLVRSFRSARRWLWLQRSLRALAQSLCAAALFALLAATLTLFQAPEPPVSWLWTACALCPAVGLLAAFLLLPSESEAIRIVDHRLGLHQQLGTAHELLRGGTGGTLVPWQLSRAADLAGDVRVSRAFPLLPVRPLVVAVLLGTVAAGILVLVSMGVVLPNPFEAIKIPGTSRESAAIPERPLFGNQSQTEGVGRKSAALDPTRQMLNQIQRQAQRGALSQAAAASALQQANAEINRAAQESLLRQQALDNLANELRSSAAGNEISQTLRQGDYQKAAQQIRELGRQTDQLSAAAKQQLSQALSNSAAQSRSLQQLSRAESRASQSIQRSDAQDAPYAMDRLASAVEDVGKQVVSQSELAQTWQQLEELNKQLVSNAQGGSEAPAAPQAAQSPDGTGEKSTSLEDGQSSDMSPAGDQSADGSGQGGGQMSTGAGSPGNVPGGPALGDSNPALGVDGKPLDLSGKIGNKFSDTADPGSQAPSVMREGDATSAGGQGQSVDSGSSVPPENVFVPNDRRSIVRDYFSSGSRGAGSQ